MKYFFRLLRVVLLFCFDIAVVTLLKIWLRFKNTKRDINNPKYGFVFTSDIGDMVIFSMFLLVFLKKVDSSCIVITSEVNARLVTPFFPNVDFLVVDYLKYKNNLIYRFQKTQEIMSFSVDCLIVPMRSRDYCISDSIANKIKKDKTIVFSSDESNRTNLEAFIEKFIYQGKHEEFLADTHELVAYKILLDNFEVDFQNELRSTISVFREKAREKNEALPFKLPQSFVLINVGTSQAYKRWPIENYIALAEKIYLESGILSLFVGGASESFLQGSFKAYPFIIDLIMKTDNFVMLRNIIVNAKYVVSNDTFVSHYSIILGIPTFSISGGGHFGRFLPYPVDDYPMFLNSNTIFKFMPCFNCKWECIKVIELPSNAPFPCISEISVKEVFAELEKLDKKKSI